MKRFRVQLLAATSFAFSEYVPKQLSAEIMYVAGESSKLDVDMNETSNLFL